MEKNSDLKKNLNNDAINISKHNHDTNLQSLENLAIKINKVVDQPLTAKSNVANLTNTITNDKSQTEEHTPYNIFAEQVLLGTIITNNNILGDVIEFLKIEHFFDDMHKKIFKSMIILADKGIGLHHISIHQQLNSDPICSYLKETQYLLHLTTISIGIFSPIDYANIVYDLAIRRELIDIAKSMIQSATKSGLEHNATDQIENAETQLFNLVTIGSTYKSFTPIKSSIDNSIAHIEFCMKKHDSVTGIPSRFIDLDNILSGFHNSDLIILAARPGMGKTTFALNLAFNAACYLGTQDDEKLKSVGILSLEMQAEQLSTKLIAMEGEIDSSKLLSGKLTESDYNKLRSAANRLSELPIFIDDTAALSIAAIRTRARRLKRKHNLGILFIDYLQLIQPSKTQHSRVLEISEITQSLKALAKELNIPIIALSQLSRAVEQRLDKRPMLSDLRDSGSIEQDADIVMFIYREEYYLSTRGDLDNSQAEKSTESYNPDTYQTRKNHTEQDNQTKYANVKNIAEILISKHRQGRTGAIKLHFAAHTSKFQNLAHDIY